MEIASIRRSLSTRVSNGCGRRCVRLRSLQVRPIVILTVNRRRSRLRRPYQPRGTTRVISASRKRKFRRTRIINNSVRSRYRRRRNSHRHPISSTPVLVSVGGIFNSPKQRRRISRRSTMRRKRRSNRVTLKNRPRLSNARAFRNSTRLRRAYSMDRGTRRKCQINPRSRRVADYRCRYHVRRRLTINGIRLRLRRRKR